jgi:hypothetical protein
MPAHDDGENAPELITLWVVVPVAAHAAAERLAKAYAKEGLEEVCAAFVCGLAEAQAGAWSLDARLLGGWISCHPWPREGDDAGKGGA